MSEICTHKTIIQLRKEIVYDTEIKSSSIGLGNIGTAMLPILQKVIVQLFETERLKKQKTFLNVFLFCLFS